MSSKYYSSHYAVLYGGNGKPKRKKCYICGKNGYWDSKICDKKKCMDQYKTHIPKELRSK